MACNINDVEFHKLGAKPMYYEPPAYPAHPYALKDASIVRLMETLRDHGPVVVGVNVNSLEFKNY